MIRERARDHGIIITDHNYDAISTVADNLFVIADGYTNPVQSWEDLVRRVNCGMGTPQMLQIRLPSVTSWPLGHFIV